MPTLSVGDYAGRSIFRSFLRAYGPGSARPFLAAHFSHWKLRLLARAVRAVASAVTPPVAACSSVCASGRPGVGTYLAGRGGAAGPRPGPTAAPGPRFD